MAEIKKVQAREQEIKKANAKVTQPKPDASKDVKVFGNLTTSGKVKTQSETEDKKVKNNISAFGSLTTSSKESATKTNSKSTIFANRLEAAQNHAPSFGTNLADIAASGEGRELTHKELTDAQIEEMQKNKLQFGTASFGISTTEAEAVRMDEVQTTAEAMQKESAKTGKLDISDGMGFGAFEDSAPQNEAVGSKSKKVIQSGVMQSYARYASGHAGSALYRQVHRDFGMLDRVTQMANGWRAQNQCLGDMMYPQYQTGGCSGGHKSKKDNSWIVGLAAGLGGLVLGIGGTLGIMALCSGSSSESAKQSGGGSNRGGNTVAGGANTNAGGSNAQNAIRQTANIGNTIQGKPSGGSPAQSMNVPTSEGITKGLDVNKPTKPALEAVNTQLAAAEQDHGQLVGNKGEAEGYLSGLNADLGNKKTDVAYWQDQVNRALGVEKSAEEQYDAQDKSVRAEEARLKDGEKKLQDARTAEKNAIEDLDKKAEIFNSAAKAVTNKENEIKDVENKELKNAEADLASAKQMSVPKKTTNHDNSQQVTDAQKAKDDAIKAAEEKIKAAKEKIKKLELEKTELEKKKEKAETDKNNAAKKKTDAVNARAKAEEDLKNLQENLAAARKRLGEARGKLKQAQEYKRADDEYLYTESDALKAIEAERGKAQVSLDSAIAAVTSSESAINQGRTTYNTALSNYEAELNRSTNYNEAYEDTSIGNGESNHKEVMVGKGDTLWGIAKKQGINVNWSVLEQIAQANNLTIGEDGGCQIQEGQTIKIPSNLIPKK